MTGYEQSNHYAGPPPGPRTFVLSAIAAAILLALAVGLL